ncbi:hypothetical protein GCM10008959_08020 [Deinococcus seoulensis]|uniref:DUF937 domain-containing protein n=1 Tax=Deinococcus seoulensis TaxID=1837379 RepID=A0ABQ2RRA8_9DEIO|nr:DUF937 domain-containing protein [Deinococcus seoulensis]GGR49215.1 hypothetical protein GCM10008959_08020 [Deinococcus seoulensis]
MMDIFNMLGGMGQAQQTVAQNTGANPGQSQAAIEAALPLLLGALTRNAAQPGGLDALNGALSRHDGSALDAFTQGQTPDTQDGQKILGHVFGGQQQQAAQAVSKRAGIDPQMAMQIMSMLAPLVLAYLSRQKQGQGGQGGGADLGSVLGGLLGGGAAGGLGGLLGGMLGGAPAQGHQNSGVQNQSAQNGGLGGLLGSVLGGAGQPQAQPTQAGGGLLGTLNNALDSDGDGSALDDLIGMFGGARR